MSNDLDQKALLFVVSGKTPWLHEPDFWTEENGDYHLLAMRANGNPGGGSGAWCGYIGFPRGLHDEDWAERNVSIHGGWTVANWHPPGQRPGYYYLGFDCDHVVAMKDGFADLTPRDHARGKTTVGSLARRYRTLPYVVAELRGAVAQLRTDLAWWKRLLRWLRGVR